MWGAVYILHFPAHLATALVHPDLLNHIANPLETVYICLTAWHFLQFCVELHSNHDFYILTDSHFPKIKH